jgi:PAS domain S-box-containing protein
VQHAIDFGEPFDLELEIITAKKNLKSVHAIGKTDLKLNKVYGFFQDITEQKKTERSLLDLHWRFESIIKGTHIGTWEWNVQTGETVYNEIWAEIIGYSLNELATVSKKTWEAHTDPEGLKKSEEMLERHFTGELSYYDCEYRMKHKNGQWIWVRDRGSVITRTNEGKPLMMFGTHSDISEQKRFEHEILLKNEELQQLNATKDKFFSIIAHDLRSPFNSIVGFSELLLDQIRQETYDGIENYAEIIKKSSGQAIKLLMNLMQWSRLQTGRMEILPEYFEMVYLINEVALFIDETSHHKGIIHNKILPESATVYADKNMISTVLRNLCSNAVKFSHPGGTVTITVKEQQNELTISVNDTGVGIEKTRINKLFLLDKSISTVGTRNEKGTGLGLILCKEFVDLNEGKIWVESEVGKGSTFYFTIPRWKKSLVNNGIRYETPVPAVEIRKNKLKILIVEDDETSERLLAIQISNICETVFEALTGVEAVDICLRNPDIDLIFMDIQLPEMDGFEATCQIREFNKDVIIIALTAYGFNGDREKAMKAGCNDYCEKPVSKDQLIKMIQKYFLSIKYST